jgi:hypothetical protein
MLEAVKLADQWRAIESELAAGWVNARLRVQISDPAQVQRAASTLGSLNAGRAGKDAFVVALDSASGAQAVRKLLGRLDAEGIAASVRLDAVDVPAVVPPAARTSVVSGWDRELGALPQDWSDVYGEIELDSSDQVARAALLLAPVNPLRVGGVKTLRFRVARVAGYGTSPQMTRRCFERLDEEGIRGTVRILRALSETDHVHTQGPVWYVGGRSV